MNDEILYLANTLSIDDNITNKICFINKVEFDNINDLSNSFMKVYNVEKSKLPYHINILDLIWANENAHSRIFAKLLKQNSQNRFDILESFLLYLKEINPNFNQKPNKPVITSEKDRIDLLILDANNFALIIENKIHGANDQPNQIARYIEKVKSRGFKASQIYVLYLTRDGRKPLQDQSWIINGINYKENFSNRYIPISFRDDILLWLKQYVLPNCRIKDVYLKSTIEQYIDYLEGIFNSRKINKEMNKELGKHIAKVLDLTSTPEDNHSTITQKINELNKVKDQLDYLKLTSEKECWIKWVDNLKRDFPNLEIIKYIDDEKYPKVGIKFEYKESDFSVIIEHKKINGTIYFGIGRHFASNTILDDVRNFAEPLLDGFSEDSWWYGWKYTSFKNGYSRLKSLIEEVVKQLSHI